MKIRSGMSISLCKCDKVLHLSLFFLAACQVTVNALWLILLSVTLSVVLTM